MLNLNSDKFFFFYDDCSNLKISPNSVEHAYLALLNNDLDLAQQIFIKIDSPRAKWGYILSSILKGYLQKVPTYFQVRNFFEIDMDLLLKNNKIDYVEQLLGSLEILSTVNQEIYKYVGRVMFFNKFYSAALKYFNQSKKIYYNDAELHFLLARYYIHIHKNDEALFFINECLNLIPEYYPAIILKQQIEETWF